MIFRPHGDVAPKTRGHALGGHTPAHMYTRQLDVPAESPASIETFDPSRSKVPKFIALDKNVLRFEGYFLEAVHESNVENFRVRKCIVLYYLEDDTIQIIEPKVENSGILQGNFVKRHRIPKPESDEGGNMAFYTFDDINIGAQVTFYGRTFHIQTADPFTRRFLESHGICVGADQPTPVDAFTGTPFSQSDDERAATCHVEIRHAHMSRETGQDMDGNYGKKQYPMKEFMEASLGKFARPTDHRRRFNQHDRHVLRWFAVWDDTAKLYGTSHRYTIHFFLADNTVEIRESYERNSGCDPFPKLLNRSRLLKQPKFEGPFATALTTVTPPPDDDFFSWEDLTVGSTISIYNRNILLLDADASTREWYVEHGIDIGPPLVLPDKTIKRPPFVPPPYNGLGSEIDSLGSCYHLTPKPHRKSMEETDNKIILRFSASMATTKPEDVLRRFVFSFMICDLSITIMEPPQRNSGIGGGKFIERGIHKHATRGTPLQKSDFYIGAKIQIVGQVFSLDNMDEYSAKYMEQHPTDFPMADRDRALTKARVIWRPALWDAVSGQTELTPAQARVWLKDVNLVPHEVIALVRGHANDEGNLDVAKLKQALTK
ncbi:Aste57867_22757 [Aphanomyces stellatus]|uniref:Aste57867_22757 protein n=1 Tax=Aphanomyces stellatus TaxID=120398 RepID=A0A485LMM1_9STRA|nr:hypothetical protein As57867_022687 [Aphanomyces stellatus]VFT99410.1 Aste57867_22757 [Aphanomyces stellatus]